ncbi:MAG: HAD-IA family hydrolase [Alphaproteobacteria bacterium]|jgi:phosphoglycolate phosphatase|nr:HAD-IA family hydrolase [Alphaproteobacteria bacterium]
MRIAGLLFDKDGTLFDFQATWGAWTRRLLQQEAGNDPTLLAALADVLGYDLQTGRFRADSLVIARTADEVAEAILPLLPSQRKPALVARMNAAAAAAPQVEAAPLAPLLSSMVADGYRLGVMTNDAEAPARAHLGAAGVEGLFDFIAGFDSGHGHKPDSGPLLAFAESVGLDPAACAMIGDSTHDLVAGRAAGMTCIGVLTGPADHAALARYADVVLPSIAQLPVWLGR